jgi:hypothetical protein
VSFVGSSGKINLRLPTTEAEDLNAVGASILSRSRKFTVVDKNTNVYFKDGNLALFYFTVVEYFFLNSFTRNNGKIKTLKYERRRKRVRKARCLEGK